MNPLPVSQARQSSGDVASGPDAARESTPFTLFLAASLCMVVFGVVLALPGTALGLSATRARLGMDLAQQGQMILLLFAGLAVATLVTGPLADRFGVQRVLAASALVIAAGLLAFAAAARIPLVATAMLMLGAGAAGINTAANVLVSELYGARRGSMLNRLALGAGTGGLVLPLLAAATAGIVPVRALAAIVAALAVAVATWTMRLRFPPLRTHAAVDVAIVWRTARLPGLRLFGLLLLLEAGNEAAMAGWTSTYGESLGLSAAGATWVLAWHWMGLVTGRALLSGMVDRIGKRRMLLGCAGWAAASAALLVALPTPAGLAIGAVSMGLALAVIFPTVLAIAGDRYRGNVGTVFGWLLAVAQLGGIVFPWLIGTVAERSGVRAGMLVIVLTTVALFGLAIPVTRAQNRG